MISRGSGGSNNKHISTGGLPFWMLMGMMNSGRGSQAEAGVDFQVVAAEVEVSAALVAEALVVAVPVAAGKAEKHKYRQNIKYSSCILLPEDIFSPFFNYLCISSGSSESKESLFPVTG